MRQDWTGLPRLGATRNVSLTIYPTATWAGCIAGTPEGDGNNVTALVTSITQTDREIRFTLRWHYELVNLPQPGNLVRLVDENTGQVLAIAALESVDSKTEKRGERSLSATARTRDASPLWRSIRWTTDDYPAGTDFSVIVEQVLRACGMEEGEFNLQPFGRWTPHSTMQLSGITAWQMLTTLLQAVAGEPGMDALGRFRVVSRDVARDADIEISTDALVGIVGSKAKPPVTAVTVKWLDRNLTKFVQQSQVLGSTSITAGFFKLTHKEKIYWSDDRTQRAENTYAKVLASVNDALIRVGTESYSQIDEFHGEMVVRSSVWTATVAAAGLAAIIASSEIPDGVQVGISGTGVTIPAGRLVEAAGVVAMMLVMMSLGTGTYEIWGQPFDYVHAVNRTEAYNDAARDWERVEEVVESDYIFDEPHAQQIAVAELLYRSLAARRTTIEIVDDPRIEAGDIIALPTGERLYVTGYSRSLSRGESQILRVEGFQV